MNRERAVIAVTFFAFGFLAGYIYDAQRNWRTLQRTAAGGSASRQEQAAGAQRIPGGLPQGHPPIDPAAVVRVLQEQASRNPKDPDARLRLANFLYDQRNFQQAAEWYQKALELDPTNADARTDLGTCYFALGRPQDALREYEKSLHTNPGHEPTLFNMVVVNLEGTRNLSSARAAWERLRRQNPNYPGLNRLKQSLEAAEAAAGATVSTGR